MSEEGRHLSILVQNPLLFDHIIERIISFVDVDSLPSVRLVSRQWENFALPKLLENVHKIPVVFRGQENLENTFSNIRMERYLSYIAEKPRLLFNDFTLKNMSFSGPLVDKFMSTCAAEITDFRVQLNIQDESNETVTELDSWMGALVNLKTLTLDLDSKCTRSPHSLPTPTEYLSVSKLKRLCLNYKDEKDANSVAACNTLRVVLESCESLEELSIGDRIPYYYLPMFFDSLHGCPNALVELSTGRLDSRTLGLLMRPGLENVKLKVLKCQILVLWDKENIFPAVLERLKNTLESVGVDEVMTLDRANVITFPDVMPKLKVFRMGLPVRSSQASLRTTGIDFSPVNFPVQLPSLEKLILYDGSTESCESNDPRDWEYLSGFFDGSGPHPKLTELCLPFASSKLRKSVGAVFPEITSLKLEVGLEESLDEISKMWPKLKYLDLTLNGDREKIRESGVDEFKKNKRAQGSSKDVDSGLISIANLKDLKQFKLQMIGDCKNSLIDFNVTRALCNSPCLEFLLFNQHDITKRGTRQFLKYHPLLKKVVCPVHPEVYKIQREYLPNNFIPEGFSTEHSVARCLCSFSK